MTLDVKNMTRSELEVQSRKMESEMSILSSRAAADPDAYKGALAERQKDYQAIHKRLQDLDVGPGVPDPEGTSPTLADAEGNFADDARTARIGGIGVRNSNTDPEGVLRKQRARLKEAGVDPDTVAENELAGVALPPEDADESARSKAKDTATPPKVPDSRK